MKFHDSNETRKQVGAYLEWNTDYIFLPRKCPTVFMLEEVKCRTRRPQEFGPWWTPVRWPCKIFIPLKILTALSFVLASQHYNHQWLRAYDSCFFAKRILFFPISFDLFIPLQKFNLSPLFSKRTLKRGQSCKIIRYMDFCFYTYQYPLLSKI